MSCEMNEKHNDYCEHCNTCHDCLDERERYLNEELEAKDKLIGEYKDRLTKQHVNFLDDFLFEIENGIVYKEDFTASLNKLKKILTIEEVNTSHDDMFKTLCLLTKGESND